MAATNSGRVPRDPHTLKKGRKMNFLCLLILRTLNLKPLRNTGGITHTNRPGSLQKKQRKKPTVHNVSASTIRGSEIRKNLQFLHLVSLKAKINFSSASNNKQLCQYLLEQLSSPRWDLAATPVFIPCHSHSGGGGWGSYAATYLHTEGSQV